MPINFAKKHGTALHVLMHGQLSYRWLHVNLALCSIVYSKSDVLARLEDLALLHLSKPAVFGY